MRIAFSLILLIIYNQSLFANNSDTTRSNYGLSLMMNYNIHSAEFKKLPSVPNCCQNFQSGTGIGFGFGGFYEYPVSNKISIGGILRFSSSDGILERDENIKVRISDDLVDGVSTHSLDSKLSYLEINPYGLYKYGNINFTLGLNFGLNMIADYSQKEEISKPSNQGVFVDEETQQSLGRTRNEFDGEITEMSSLNLGINFGIGYQLPMNKSKTLMIEPNIKYNYGLNNIHSELNWTISTLSAGVNIRYFPKPEVYVSKDIYKIDTIETKKDYIKNSYISKGLESFRNYKKESNDTIMLVTEIQRTDTLVKVGIDAKYDPSKPIKKYRYKNTNLSLIAYNKDKQETELDEIYMKVELTREIYPLLPYVFFDENSAIIPQRYKKINDYKKFDASKLEASPITYHRNNLNIIGQRMLLNPNAKIEITGYIDPTTELDRCDLALDRAMSVKNYLITIFEISSDRIIAKINENSCYPEDLTRSKTKEAFQENRRVVISTEKPQLLFAVNRAIVQEPTEISPPIINVFGTGEIFVTKYEPYYPYSKEKQEYELEKPNFNELSISQIGYPLFNQTYSETSVKKEIVFTRQNIQNLQGNIPLEFRFATHDIDNRLEAKSMEIDVKKDTAQIAVEKLTLTIFQVSQSNLDSRIKKEIKKFISNLDDNTEILIKGYSDNLGDYNSNKNLSAHRANEVKNYINQIAPNAKVVSVKGVGSDEFPPGVYSYNSPEERFISRTVEIEIRTKVK